MKKILVAAAIMVSMISCSKDQTISLNQEAIGFDNAFINNSTKSVNDPSWSNDNLFQNFAVYGYVENASLFNNVKVTGSSLNDVWTYDNTQYWIAGAKYNFAAIAPYNNGTVDVFNVAKNSDDYVGTTVLNFENTDGTNDILYAQNSQIIGASSDNAKISFSFRHLLSKVKFSFENAYNASTATIKVYDIQIENAWQNATATLGTTSTEWGNQNNTKTIIFGNASDDEATVDAKEAIEVAYAYGKTYESLNERLLIPGVAPEVTYNKVDANGTTSVTEKAYKVTFKVDLLVNGTLIKTYNHTAYAKFTPEAGNSYDIKTTINASNIDPEKSQEPIEFTVNTINDWDTDKENQSIN